MSKRLSAMLSSAQLSTRLYDTVHSIQTSLRDTTMEVEFTKSRNSRRIPVAPTPTGEDTVRKFEDLWYELGVKVGVVQILS